MKRIPCEMIKDLLPSYIEHLTSDVSNQLIEEHLQDCPACRDTAASMKEPPSGGQEADIPEIREIDYLKKTRKRTWRIVICALAAAALVALAIVFISRYVVGYYYHDPRGDLFSWNVEISGSLLEAEITSVQNIYKITGVTFTEQDGVVDAEIRAVPAGLIARVLYGDEYRAGYRAQQDITRFTGNGRILWEEGQQIPAPASVLFATRHAYMGDMPANDATARALNLSAYLGAYQNELLTQEPPYTWKILLQEDIPASAREHMQEDMERFACVLLALIDNLDQVTYTYTVDGKYTETTVSTEAADLYSGVSVKEYGSTAAGLDELLHKLQLHHYAFGRTFFPPYGAAAMPETSANVYFNLVNGTDEDITSVEIGIYRNGELCSTQGAMNADENVWKHGDIFTFFINEMDWKGEWDPAAVLTIGAVIYTADGASHEIAEQMRLPALPGNTGDIQIIGDAQTGFRLSQ